MEELIVLVITWMVIVGLVSTLLIGFIIQHIHNKPPISITLVDLIYCDSLCWIWIMVCIYCTAIISIHLSPR